MDAVTTIRYKSPVIRLEIGLLIMFPFVRHTRF